MHLGPVRRGGLRDIPAGAGDCGAQIAGYSVTALAGFSHLAAIGALVARGVLLR